MKASTVTAVLRAALVAVLLLAPAAAFAAGSPYDKLDKGPKVGAAMPHPLTTADQNGTKQDFASLRGARGLVLLFSRSLNW